MMMAIATSARPFVPQAPNQDYQRYCFSIEQYYKMAKIGILNIDARTELIAGEIIEMSPIGTKHAASLSKLADLLRDLTRNLRENRVLIRQQNPVQLSDRTEPQPDIAIVVDRDDYYADAHPQPADILLLIEVADSTIKYDREVKAKLYAKAGILELWIVNLDAQVFEVYRQPHEGIYTQMQIYQKGQTVSLVCLPDVAIAVSEIF